MNKYIKSLFIWLLPFYPLWSWISYSVSNKPIDFFVSFILIPFAFYYVIYPAKKLPRYLLFFIIFTIYHLGSVLINDTIPNDTNKVYFLLSDFNLRACLFLIIIESSVFDEEFILRMNKHVLIIVIISLVVSMVQTKIPTFFFNSAIDEDSLYVGDNRVFSIYSWISLNTGGITFPFLISILLNVYDKKKSILPIVVISGVVVSFVTRARYIMISAIVVLSQLFFSNKRSISKRIYFVGIFFAGLFFIALIADNFGYDINEVINNRIMEKGNQMSSAKVRILSYDVFMMVFPEHPWVGVGPKTRQDVLDLLDGDAPYIHVGYLSYLYYYGIVGCFFFFTALFLLLRVAWTVGRRDNFWGVFYGLVSFCFANLTFVYFDLSEMGIVISLIYLRYYNYKSTLELDETWINEQQ